MRSEWNTSSLNDLHMREIVEVKTVDIFQRLLNLFTHYKARFRPLLLLAGAVGRGASYNLKGTRALAQ